MKIDLCLLESNLSDLTLLSNNANVFKSECVCVLPLQSEAQTVYAGFDEVLGLQVVHAVGGNAVDGQNHVADAHLSSGCFASIGELQRRQHHFHLHLN